MLEVQSIQCPYCGEPIDVFLDWSVPCQIYTEDCQVCCRPIELKVTVQGDVESGQTNIIVEAASADD